MNIRTIATFAVAILLGLVAVLLVRGYLGSAKKAAGLEPGAAGALTPVVVASAPIVRGQVLQPIQLKVVSYPAASVPAGSFQTVAQLTGAGPNARLALRGLVANEPILPDKVSAPGGKLTLSVALAPGMRAVSLRSNDIAGVAGFVLPGDRVDLLLTRAIPGGEGTNAVTQALAENVLVMAVDQSDNDEANKPVVARTITLEVTPDQAQIISLAQTVGSVSLSLRHVADDALLTRKATTVAQLGYFAPPRAATAPAGAAGAPGARPRLARGMGEVRVTRGVDMATYAVSMR